MVGSDYDGSDGRRVEVTRSEEYANALALDVAITTTRALLDQLVVMAASGDATVRTRVRDLQVIARRARLLVSLLGAPPPE